MIGYFYFGGISGASAVIAAFSRLYGGASGAQLARIATYVSFLSLRPVPRSAHSRSRPASPILPYAARVPGQLADVDWHLGTDDVRGHLGAGDRSPTPG